MTPRTRWSRVFASASLFEVGAFLGSVTHTTAAHALVWAVLLFVAAVALVEVER